MVDILKREFDGSASLTVKDKHMRDVNGEAPQPCGTPSLGISWERTKVYVNDDIIVLLN